MLKVLWIFLLILSDSSIAESFEWRMGYDPRVIPSCVILTDAGYWEWRTLQGQPEDIENDLNKLYSYYLEGFATKQRSTQLSSEEATCNGKFLMSPELARIMNVYGEIADFWSFYYTFIALVSELDSEYQYKALDRFELEDVVTASIIDIESRFVLAEFCADFEDTRGAEVMMLSDKDRPYRKEYFVDLGASPVDYIITHKSADGSLPLRADMVNQFGGLLFDSALLLDEPDVAMWLLTQGVDPFQSDGITSPATGVLFEENWRELYNRADEATDYRYSEQFDEYRRFRRHCM